MFKRLFSFLLLSAAFVSLPSQLLAKDPTSSGTWQPDPGEAYLQYQFRGGAIESFSDTGTHRNLVMEGSVNPGETILISCTGTQPARDTKTTTIQSTLVMAYIKTSPRVESKKTNEAEQQKKLEKYGSASVTASYRVPNNVKTITASCYVRPSWFNMNGGFSAVYAVQTIYKVSKSGSSASETNTPQRVPQQNAPFSQGRGQPSGNSASRAHYGWVLTERKPVRGVMPAAERSGEARVEFGNDAIEMLLTKPYGNGAGGSRDINNPQRLHARYSWTVPDVIQPAGQLVIVVQQEVSSNRTGKWANAFGVGIAIDNNWYLKGKTANGTMVEPWVFGIGSGRPDWAQRDAEVSYERTWLWNEGRAGEKRTVSVSIQGVGTQRFEYVYEWKGGR